MNGFTGKNRSRGAIGVIACTPMLLGFLYAAYLFFTAPYAEHAQIEVLAPWISAGGFEASFRFYLDPLSMLMTLVVTGVGFLIHVYATSYMAHEDGFYRFFAYLNLFCFFVLDVGAGGQHCCSSWDGKAWDCARTC